MEYSTDVFVFFVRAIRKYMDAFFKKIIQQFNLMREFSVPTNWIKPISDWNFCV